MTAVGKATLDSLARRHGTDKAGGRHGFAEIYERHLQPWRDRPVHLLEIGVKDGASLRMWRDYFPNGQILGIDRTPSSARHAEPPNVQVFVGSQDDHRVLGRVVDEAGPLDIVIDDGSHRYPHQRASLLYLWPHLADGGVYIMEDLHTSYSARYGMGFRQRESTIEFLKDLVDDLHVHLHKQAVTVGDVEAIAFYRGTCVLTKRAVG
ncbi:MAG: class I SAM-dependent methyltransferase [Solirubrobacteraceae bacterium MAG38_C4-C5]|nr:class I SAM-dependent methyltransferase [Candidatus Siliceabacter maunaloa]